jgi:hypothetical protein
MTSNIMTGNDASNTLAGTSGDPGICENWIASLRSQ